MRAGRAENLVRERQIKSLDFPLCVERDSAGDGAFFARFAENRDEPELRAVGVERERLRREVDRARIDGNRRAPAVPECGRKLTVARIRSEGERAVGLLPPVGSRRRTGVRLAMRTVTFCIGFSGSNTVAVPTAKVSGSFSGSGTVNAISPPGSGTARPGV